MASAGSRADRNCARRQLIFSASSPEQRQVLVLSVSHGLKTIQYQLWIFDKDRDQAFSVDGDVFDVSSTGGVEKPGGVVVSKRERIVVTAAPKA